MEPIQRPLEQNQSSEQYPFSDCPPSHTSLDPTSSTVLKEEVPDGQQILSAPFASVSSAHATPFEQSPLTKHVLPIGSCLLLQTPRTQ